MSGGGVGNGNLLSSLLGLGIPVDRGVWRAIQSMGGLREGAGVLRQGGESSVNLTPLCLVQEVMGHFTGRVKEENGAVL